MTLLAERFGFDTDTVAAMELGISKDKYLMWKNGFADTYLKQAVTPVEGEVPIVHEDGVILARNAFIGKAKRRKWGVY